MEKRSRQNHIKLSPPLPTKTWHRCFINKQNIEAVDFLKNWHKYDYSSVIINGSGSNFLGNIWATSNNAFVINSLNSLREFVQNGVVENVLLRGFEDLIKKTHHQELVFHLINKIHEHNRTNPGEKILGVFTAHSFSMPKLADLSSRLKAMLVFDLYPPDDQLTLAILHDLFSKKQLTVKQSVIDYLIPRVPRDAKTMENLIDLVEEKVYIYKSNVSISLVKLCLQNISDFPK